MYAMRDANVPQHSFAFCVNDLVVLDVCTPQEDKSARKVFVSYVVVDGLLFSLSRQKWRSKTTATV